MAHQHYGKNLGCPVEACLEVIGGKWKSVILFHLIDQPKRFSDLRRLTPAVTQRMLTRQLRELETAQLINRSVSADATPLRVEYALSTAGRSLCPLLFAIRDWGLTYLEIAQKDNNAPCLATSATAGVQTP